jgi:hypothetical protein
MVGRQQSGWLVGTQSQLFAEASRISREPASDWVVIPRQISATTARQRVTGFLMRLSLFIEPSLFGVLEILRPSVDDPS